MSGSTRLHENTREHKSGAGAAPRTRNENDADNARNPQDSRQSWQRRLLDDLRLGVQREPLQVATMASIPVACVLAFAVSGYSLFDSLIGASGHHDAAAALAVLTAAMFGVSTHKLLGAIRDKAEREARDKAADERQEYLVTIVNETIEALRDGYRRLEERMDLHDGHTRGLSGEIDDLRLGMERMRETQAPRMRAGPNVAAIWSNYAPGSTCYNMGGQGRLDLAFERRSDGTLIFKPDWDRLIQTWYLRFKAETAVGRANIVIFMGDRRDGAVPDQLATHLVIFRCIKLLGERLGSKVLLSRARFYLIYGKNPAESIFVGEQRMPSGETQRFMHSYSDRVERYAIPGVLQDGRVSTSHEAEDIDSALALINAVMADHVSHSYEELETLFGHRVSGPKLPERGIFGPVSAKPAVFARRRPGEEIANGDHMDI